MSRFPDLARGLALAVALTGAAAAQDTADAPAADPARQEWIEARLAALGAVARKHRVDTRELPALRDTLAAELAELGGGDREAAGRVTHGGLDPADPRRRGPNTCDQDGDSSGRPDPTLPAAAAVPGGRVRGSRGPRGGFGGDRGVERRGFAIR